jgi:hypothetical protein
MPRGFVLLVLAVTVVTRIVFHCIDSFGEKPRSFQLQGM